MIQWYYTIKMRKIIMKDEDLVDKWCIELNLENEGWLNKGEFGNTFTLTDNKIIKITTDAKEFIETFNLLKKQLDFHPYIYDMRVFPGGELGILMEEVVTDGIENVFFELKSLADDENVDILDIEDDNNTLSEEAVKMLNDLNSSVLELRSLGNAGSDIHDGNIGINAKGNYVLFDQTVKSYNNEYNEDLLEDIREKLLSSYDIDEDNPIIKEDICISNILVNRDSMRKTLLNISNGKGTKTKGHIECMYNKNGDIQLTDGHHRLCEQLLMGKETTSIVIDFDERYGLSSPVFKLIEKDESLELDPTEVYGGLEDIAEPDILEEYINDYKKSKRRKYKNRP